MTRLTENDKHFGPFTFGRTSWRPIRAVWSSGGDGDDGRTRNSFTAYAFGWVVQIRLPNLIKPYRIKHAALSWDAATIERMGRDWYYETHPREYGFCYSEGFLQVFMGPQTHDSSTTKSWAKFLPWTQWRHVRYSLYDRNGEHFWTEPERSRDYKETSQKRESVPKVVFEFDDYDGKRIKATTHIEEREWRFGEGWFKWLSAFRKPLIRRNLAIKFSEEVGPEKGSWKGGTIGHGIDMLPGELHEDAFRRYCAKEHRSKNGRFRVDFVGKL